MIIDVLGNWMYARNTEVFLHSTVIALVFGCLTKCRVSVRWWVGSSAQALVGAHPEPVDRSHTGGGRLPPNRNEQEPAPWPLPVSRRQYVDEVKTAGRVV